MKKLIQLDENGYFSGVVTADESPLEPGVFLIPGGAIEAVLPNTPEGKFAKWVDGWVFEDAKEKQVTDTIFEPTYRDFRAAAYPPVGDQLDAMWKGGEAEAAMKETIMTVKAEYPKP